MSALDQLASSLGRRDEVPNVEFAERIVAGKDAKSIKELVEALQHKNKNVQSDSIKVLYEIGEREPSLISVYAKQIGLLLADKNNRLVWGALTALDTITGSKPADIYKMLPSILDAAEKGSVIAKDHALNILVKLSADKKYTSDTLPLLFSMLKEAANNQFSMYAENSLVVVSPDHKLEYVSILNSRIKTLEKDSQKKRIEKILKRLAK